MDSIAIKKDGQIYDIQTAQALGIKLEDNEQIKADDSPEALEIAVKNGDFIEVTEL